MVMENGKTTQLDTDVSYMSVKPNGRVVYIKGYDETAGTGDLYYYNGKETVCIDQGVTAVMGLLE